MNSLLPFTSAIHFCHSQSEVHVSSRCYNSACRCSCAALLVGFMCCMCHMHGDLFSWLWRCMNFDCWHSYMRCMCDGTQP